MTDTKKAYPRASSLSLRVLYGPFSGDFIVLLPVRFVQLSDVGYQRVFGIRIGEQRAYRQQHFGNGERGRPLVFEDVQADASLVIDVAVVDFRRELDLWRFEGIVLRKHTRASGSCALYFGLLTARV